MEESNKRIAKNTVYLYIRTFVMMILSFVTTRIVLDKLGASDYGINNVVAGFVSLFAVLNNILSSGTSRFMTLALGKNDIDEQKRTFSTSLTLHLLIAFVVVLLLEILGFWFLNTKLNIEPDRIWAARWVFHIAVFNMFWQITQTPFSAIVTAHEHFNMYAYMSIYDVVMKLLVVYLLVVIPYDKLIIYSLLQMFVSFSSMWIYRIYCIKKFSEVSFVLRIDKKLCKQILNFSGWGIFGHIMYMVNVQGGNIILNLFYNTVMNAARGLANTVSFVIAQFVAGFQVAALPQLIKFWGANERLKFDRLIFNVTQYSVFLLAIFAVPILLELDFVIDLWLGKGNVPKYTVEFVKITTICSIIYRGDTMVGNGLMAAGLVKQQNIASSFFLVAALPIMYFVLWMGWGPIVACWVGSFNNLCQFGVNLVLIKKYIGFDSWSFFKITFIKNYLLIGVSYLISLYVQSFFEYGWLRFFVVCFVAVVITTLLMYFIALNAETKTMVRQKVLGCLIKQFREV